MKNKRFFLLPIFAFCYLLSADNAQPAPAVSFGELLDSSQVYDGRMIIFEGEVIGDIMIRGKFAWLNVRDKEGAIGVFCPADMAHNILHAGSYRSSGDIISVRGRFHRFCRQHGADTDIHAAEIDIIERGKETLHPLKLWKVKAAVILPVIASVLAVTHLLIMRRVR